MLLLNIDRVIFCAPIPITILLAVDRLLTSDYSRALRSTHVNFIEYEELNFMFFKFYL